MALKRTTKSKKVKKNSAVGRIAFAALVTLAVLALAFFLVMRDQGRESVAENAVGSIFQPVENAITSATRYIRDVVNGVKDYVSISENYELAQQENTSLKLQLQALEEAQQENLRLTELLDAQETYSAMDPIYAKVIARDPGVWFDSFSIDRGQKDGLEVNMAVITGDGLVGRIYETGLNYAKVMSIIDTRSSVACLIERTRDNGVMRGQIAENSESAECYMYYLPAVNDIIPGDVVLTSGVDSMYPKGLIVGTVKAVSRQSDISDQYIIVSPSADFLHVEEVLVLRQVVASEDNSHAVLYTPTPRPTAEPTPVPESTIAPENTPGDPNEQLMARPTPAPEGGTPAPEEDLPPTEKATPSPTPTYDPDTMQPEDQW